jgi:hypothetical protein
MIEAIITLPTQTVQDTIGDVVLNIVCRGVEEVLINPINAPILGDW